MKKAVIAGAFLILVLLCLTACGKEDTKDKGVLVYWEEPALRDVETSLDIV